MRNITTLYREYRESYKKAATKLKQKLGLEMYDEMLKFQEFEAIYQAFSNDMGGKSDRKKELEIINNIITRQRTEFSPIQARAFQEGWEIAFQEKISLKQAYIEGPAKISELNEELKKEGIMVASERAHIIATTFFGSPA